MKYYIIGILSVIILFLGSVVYKQQNTMVCHHFPVPESMKKESADVPFYLFLFFSKNDCFSCLSEIIDMMNKLPSEFCVAGIVPEDELKDESQVKHLTGASFPLYSYREYKKYLPWHTPTLFGVSRAGRIIFVLPGIPGQRANMENSLISIYGKLHTSLTREYSPGRGDERNRR